MKNILYIVAILFLTNCSFFEAEEVFNPNQGDAAELLQDASITQIQSVITGLESRHRNYVTATSRAFGSFGREVFVFFDSDPRFTRDWLGRALPPDASFFGVVGGTYNFPYQAIKHGNYVMDVAAASSAISAAELAGIDGFVKTIQAYQYMVVLNGLYQNGIRLDVSNVLEPGPFLSYDAALAGIRSLLDEAATDLGNAGSEFAFSLTGGFAGFDSPATFTQFNRAVAARAAIYAEDWTGALTALGASYLDASAGADLDAGPTHLYAGPPDVFNPFFFPADQFSTQIVVVHPSVLNDIEAGDTRANKFLARSAGNLVNNSEYTDYVGTHQDARFTTNTSALPYLRNEELILMRAEARAQSGDLPGAVADIDYIRAAAGLAAFPNPGNAADIVTQILTERRFSLWFEPWGHRWIDARRYDRLDEIPTIAADESIFTQLAIPQSEINFEESQDN